MRRMLIVSACLLLAVTSALAVGVRTWTLSAPDGFSSGTLDGTAIDREGRLTLAPTLETLWGPDEGVVWEVLPARNNGVFVALSGPGRVLEVGEGDDPRVWYSGGEAALATAIASDGKGGIYVGVSPDGTVLHLRKPEEADVVVETGAKFIWALASDGHGTLWIGTGVPGQLMRRVKGGEASTVFESEDDPVRCVAPSSDGGAVIGTGGQGRVIRIDAEGKAFVLHDADEDEIVSVVVDDRGTVYALAAGGSNAAPDPIRAAKTTNNSVTVVATPPGGSAPKNSSDNGEKPAKADKKKKTRTSALGGVLYRIDTTGEVRKLWQTATEMPFDLLLGSDDRILVATGDAGRLYEIDRDGRSSVPLRIASDQASALARTADGRTIVGGSGDARVSRMGAGTRPAGSFLAEPIDAGTVAEWGRLSWEAGLSNGGSLRFAVRAGNTEEPDDTWTDWSEIEVAEGRGGAPTSLPRTRWFQVRADLNGGGEAAPGVRSVRLSYLPRNRQPEVSKLVLEPAGVVWSPGPVQIASLRGPVVADDPAARRAARSLRPTRTVIRPIRKSYELGARTFHWKGKDPDDDRLNFSLEIRPEGSENWFTLVSELDRHFYSWDARSLPDGSYQARLTVDDGRDNPEGRQLSQDVISESFRIDNTRPSVQRSGQRREGDVTIVDFVATDEGGRIEAVEVAIGSGRWTIVAPIDGVADSAQETYAVRVEGAGPNAGSLRVRVTDAVGNQAGDLWILE